MKYILAMLDVVFAMSLFFVLIYSYYLGVKHGKQLAKGIVPKVNINPAVSLKEYIKDRDEKKEEDNAQEGWYGEYGIMNYDPYKVKKEGE
jgi:hypothetical protein